MSRPLEALAPSEAPASPAATRIALERIEQSLLSRDFLYDSPPDYRDGVSSALDALREALA